MPKALEGHSLLSDSVIDHAAIFLFHFGRSHSFSVVGNGFITLPLVSEENIFEEVRRKLTRFNQKNSVQN